MLDAEGGERDTSLSYDYVFEPGKSTKDVYGTQCAPIVQRSLEGFNGTIFAYGQTGSGKTHTLMGHPETNPGIVYLALDDLYNYINKNPTTEVQMEVSFLEIYNEKIHDLLNPKNGAKLEVTEHSALGPMVRGLTSTPVHSAAHALSVLQKGEKSRHVRSTEMNARSSRSHTLFQLRVQVTSLQGAAGDEESMEKVQENMKTVADLLMKLKQKLSADCSSLYLVDAKQGELYIQSGKLMLRIPLGSGIAGQVGQNGLSLNIPDAYEDDRFNADIDKKTGYRTKSILCAALKSEDGKKIVGVVQFINKVNGEPRFSDEDMQHVKEFTTKAGPLVSRTSGLARVCKSALLNIVDLAGSERASRARTSGQALKEGANINKSLMNLGTCISMLSKGTAGHIPYRNSKLTRLLSTSLGGNALTSIICTIAPTTRDCNQSLSTLSFATRAMSIINNAKKNESRDPSEMLQIYEREIKALKRRLTMSQPNESEKVKELTNKIRKNSMQGQSVLSQFSKLYYAFEPASAAARELEALDMVDFQTKVRHLEKIADAISEIPGPKRVEQPSAMQKLEQLREVYEQLRREEEANLKLTESVKDASDAYRKFSDDSEKCIQNFELKAAALEEEKVKLNTELKKSLQYKEKHEKLSRAYSDMEKQNSELRADLNAEKLKSSALRSQLATVESNATQLKKDSPGKPNKAASNDSGNELAAVQARSVELKHELKYAKQALEQYTSFFNDWKKRLSN